MTKGIGAALLLLANCAGAPPHAAGEQGPPPDPVAFFAGRSHGEGTIDPLLGSTRQVRVSSVGVKDAKGDLVLDQHIEMEGKSPRDRRWTMTPNGAGRWTGTLTDAVGPVNVTAEGRALHIRYRMAKGLSVEQWLVARDGRTLANRMTISKVGLTVARLDETIVRD